MRVSRSLILTTHYMDEAETLSDRIVILSKGKVKAIDSSNDLKERHKEYDLKIKCIIELESYYEVKRTFTNSQFKTIDEGGSELSVLV